MPILGMIALMAGTVGLIGFFISRGRGSGAVPPLGLPPPGVSVPKETAIAIEAVEKGTATPEILANGAQAALEAGFTGTANDLSRHLDKQVTQTIPAIVAAPDRPSTPIPTDARSGKPLWSVENRGGTVSVIPQFSSVLSQFKGLQAQLKVAQDGRLGPGTLAAFQKRTSEYVKAPKTIEGLAANAVKWTEILRGGFGPGGVGYHPFANASGGNGSLTEAWKAFMRATGAEMKALVPRVREKFGDYVDTSVEIDDVEHVVTLSGLLGIVSKGGMRGAEQWLKNPEDRKRYPHTTEVFERTNGLF